MPTMLTKILPCTACRKLRHFYGVTEDFVPDNELCLGCESARYQQDKQKWRPQERRA